MKFKIFGHKNVLSTHKNTIEFTKNDDLTKNGDCIIGVCSDFVFDKTLLNYDRIKISIICDGVTDSFEADVNKDFDDEHELVIRKTDFVSKRTLGLNSTKASVDIDKRIVEKLKDKNNFAKVVIEGLE